jgi:hypothetical protein
MPGGDEMVPTSAGAAGAAGEPAPECARDEHCQNESMCDGSERCADGQCLPGEAVECQYGAHCDDEATPLCIYDKPSPWLIATTTQRVSGLPVALLNEVDELLTLAERPKGSVLTGYDKPFWAPNGKVALVRSFEDRMGSRLSLMRFGAGLPSSLEPVPDLPNWGDYWDTPVFSADSNWVSVTDNYTGTYLVDLKPDAVPPQLQPRAEFSAPRLLCADPDAWLPYVDSEESLLAALVDGELATRSLGTGSITLSPDGRLLLIGVEDADGDEVGLQLGSCSAETWLVNLDGASHAVFSPDSQLLLLELREGGMKLLSLTDPAEPAELWSNLAARPAVERGFSPDSQKLVFLLSDATEEEPSLHVIELGELPTTEGRGLALPAQGEVVALGDEAVLMWSSSAEGEPPRLLWRALEPAVDEDGKLEPPLVLVEDAALPTTVTSHAFDSRTVFLTGYSKDLDQTTVSRLLFDASQPELVELGTFAGSAQSVEATPRDYGVAVLMEKGLIDVQLFWIGFAPDGVPASPRLLADQAFSVSIQPWR